MLEGDRDAGVVLGEIGDRRTEFDGDAEFGEPGPQDGLGVGLAEDPGVRVGHVRCRGDGFGHPALAHRGAAEVGAHDRQIAPGGQDRVEHAEVVEHFQGARLDAVAARTGERHGGPVDDAHRDAAPGQIEGEGEPGRARSGDNYLVGHGKASETLE